METADGLFRTPQGSPRTDELIAASIQWAKKIMEKIDYDRGGTRYEGRPLRLVSLTLSVRNFLACAT
jgi:hypothetical protein